MGKRKKTVAGDRTRTPRSGSSAARGKPVQKSQTEMVEVVLPGHANPLSNILGGRV